MLIDSMAVKLKRNNRVGGMTEDNILKNAVNDHSGGYDGKERLQRGGRAQRVLPKGAAKQGSQDLRGDYVPF